MLNSLQVKLGLKNWYDNESSIKEEALKILEELRLPVAPNIIEQYHPSVERINEEQFSVEISHHKMTALYKLRTDLVQNSYTLIVGGNEITCKETFKNIIKDQVLPSLKESYNKVVSDDEQNYFNQFMPVVDALIAIINDGLGLKLSVTGCNQRRVHLKNKDSIIRLNLKIPNELEVNFGNSGQSFYYTLQNEIESIYKEADSICMFIKTKIELNS